MQQDVWNPGFEGSLFDDLLRIQRQMESVFGSPMTAGIRSMGVAAFPPVNVGTTPEEIDVYLFAPGVDPTSLDINIQNNVLTVSGERRIIREKAPATTARSGSTGNSVAC